MSFLSQLPEQQYRRNAFEKFRAESSLNLGTAKAMIWMSQLAYETDEGKIDRILTTWGLKRRNLLSGPTSRLLLERTRCIVVTGANATIISFVGTDPLLLGHWITVLDCGLSPGNLHNGFEKAQSGIWQVLKEAIVDTSQGRLPLFITGHSSGGALANIVAERAWRELNAPVSGVYTFGGLRPGGERFLENYPLHNVTYRFVHGDDLFSTWPTRRMGYRHVGQLLYCNRGGLYDKSRPIAEDTRDFLPTLFRGLGHWIYDLFWTPARYSVRTDFVGRLLRLLPTPIGDHIPDRYARALDGLP